MAAQHLGHYPDDFGSGAEALASAFLWQLCLDSHVRSGLSVNPRVLALMCSLCSLDPDVVAQRLHLRGRTEPTPVEERWLSREATAPAPHSPVPVAKYEWLA